jgi:hypothetical protein
MDRVGIVFLSLVIVALSAPLILRLVPPNPFYGLRTSRSMADEGLWYQVNAFADYVGRGLLESPLQTHQDSLACLRVASALAQRFGLDGS